MCVYSMVHDYWNDRIPWVEISPFTPYVPTVTSPNAAIDLEKVLEDFRRAGEAARTVDELTGQKDCLDPEKARLQERVDALEAMLKNPPEFVILKGGQIEPGRYRVIDGLLYRLVDQDQV